jgi:hypothetical protein
MDIYGNGVRAYLLVKPGNIPQLLELLDSMDNYERLRKCAVLCDIGGSKFKTLPKIKSDLVKHYHYQHNFLINLQ